MNQTLTLGRSSGLNRDTRLVFELLEKISGGVLEIRLPDGSCALFGEGEPGVTMQVHDEAMFGQILARGDIGLAEAYLDGAWDSPDITGLLGLLARNRDVLKKAVYGSWRGLAAARIRHWLNRNSKAGSKRNIMAHYDLGNDFYKLWLDPGMSYSSALFRAGEVDRIDDLEAAQAAKYRRILQHLHAEPGQRVLEIGCGWGGFAEEAVAEGLAVTGLTLSPAQLAWAQKRVPQADLRLQDYRDTKERFDHVVSIEMFEAVGERFWPGYFKTVAAALKPGGRAVIQSITIRDDLFASYRKGTDFIQQYVFPGGMLPSRSAFRSAAARAGLVVRGEYAFGEDYARTLAEWRHAFEAHWPQIAALGFDEPFRRLWRMYLCYCEAGFLAGNVDVVQFELAHR
ncbi:methyltransferase domain-containing protein [Dechloromonas sp. TW-R-39-2]|uniref:SAM-dependent methyltransferase n=1 Tax=Dechloromonas sp. TW-R-39-2 TaxID=2654218 RepID=UPI00193CD54F|nr:cyclopropane-fatty-acyl-phospholipid synthase family protein [Dechloromonas sp. TW-R-39-2]QRM18698.1 methyltransferase domain-containing protein [Dechloromonas sp. TW-R-39-2]